MGVPILYQGSQYYPGIPPSKQYPAFSSAEVGNVNASTVAVTFSVNVSASDYATGVTIKVNGATATISSATRQSNHAIVYYVLSAAVVNGDTVTWEYSGGSIVNEATSAAMQTTSAQSVTNNVAPVPVAPQFSAAEIGTVNASTVAVTFDSNVTASNYATGVTIKINGTATSITSATRQANHAIVRYVIPVLWHGSGDAVTWEYASGSGSIISESDSTPLGDVTAQSVTNNCEYAALLDLQADTLALNDGDAVTTWADQSGQGHNFTAVTPFPETPVIRQTDGDGYHYVKYNVAGPNYCDGGTGEWINNLDSFTGFSVEDPVDFGSAIASKMNNTNTAAGWLMDYGNRIDFIIQEDGGNNYINMKESASHAPIKCLATRELISKSIMNIYRNGVLDDNDLSNPPVSDYSSSDHVLLGTLSELSGSNIKQYALLICAPAPNAANRAALEARLAARYGITL